jgi:hypothetical protein
MPVSEGIFMGIFEEVPIKPRLLDDCSMKMPILPTGIFFSTHTLANAHVDMRISDPHLPVS